MAPNGLFGQRREAVTGGKNYATFFLRKELFRSFLFNQLGGVQTGTQLTRWSSALIKWLEDTWCLHVSVEASNRLETG